MNNNNEATVTRLQTKLDSLYDQLGKTTLKSNNAQEIINAIKQAEKELKDKELLTKIEALNVKAEAERKILKEVFKLGYINPSLLNNDNKLNKNKSKQAPELYEFAEKFNANFRIKYDNIVEITVYKKPYSMQFVNSFIDYAGNKQLKEFASFEAICKANRVLFKSLKVETVRKQLNNVNKATEAFRLAQDKYKESLKKNDSYFLECENFLYSSDVPTKELTSRF